jgi:hypothetical protein
VITTPPGEIPAAFFFPKEQDFSGTADVPSAFALSGNADADKMSAVPVKPWAISVTGLAANS